MKYKSYEEIEKTPEYKELCKEYNNYTKNLNNYSTKKLYQLLKWYKEACINCEEINGNK